MQFDSDRMARLAGIEDAEEKPVRSRDLIREGLQEYFDGGLDEADEYDETEKVEECDEPKAMAEARLRKIISREIRAAIEELRKSRGQPIMQLKRRSRLI